MDAVRTVPLPRLGGALIGEEETFAGGVKFENNVLLPTPERPARVMEQMAEVNFSSQQITGSSMGKPGTPALKMRRLLKMSQKGRHVPSPSFTGPWQFRSEWNIPKRMPTLSAMPCLGSTLAWNRG